MTVFYYSAKSGGFYTEEHHGARLIAIPDPDWVRPMKAIIETDENGIELSTEVPDIAAQPPEIVIDNPECKMPDDVVKITEEEHASLLAAAAPFGRVIVAGPDGKPIVADPPAPTTEEFWVNVRRERDTRLSIATAKLDRYRNQKEFGIEPSMTDAHAVEWAVYAQALRDLPETQADPANIEWPSAPA